MRALTFSGILNDNGNFTSEPGFIIDGTPEDSEGDIEIEVFSRSGKPLANSRLQLDHVCAHPSPGKPPVRPSRVVNGLVKFPEKAHGYRVTYDGRVLLERCVPDTPSQNSVRWPDNLDKPKLVIRWDSTHPEAMAILAYSNDNGETFAPLSIPSTNPAIEFNTENLAGGKKCLLELIVTDGFHTEHLQSPRYELKPRGWQLWLLLPGANETYPADATIQLAAQGFHLEKRQPNFDDITWFSSRDGGLGQGAQLQVRLSPGKHRITAKLKEISSTVDIVVKD